MPDQEKHGEWTVETLRQHMLALRDADKTAIAAALSAAERAVAKAEEAAEKRFEGLNELRKVVTDLLATLMPRAESDTKFAAMSEKTDLAVANLTKELGGANTRLDRLEGGEGGKIAGALSVGSIFGYIFGAVGAIVALWVAFHAGGH